MKIRCPSCRQWTEYSEHNPFRPFCSERCRILDLGAWADESYRVPVSEQELERVNEKTRAERASEDLAPPKHQLN